MPACTQYLVFVFPLLNLTTAFIQLCEQSPARAAATIVHLLGNPIDALQSIMRRQSPVDQSRSITVAGLARMAAISYATILLAVICETWCCIDDGCRQTRGQTLSLIAVMSHLSFAVYLTARTDTSPSNGDVSQTTVKLLAKLPLLDRTPHQTHPIRKNHFIELTDERPASLDDRGQPSFVSRWSPFDPERARKRYGAGTLFALMSLSAMLISFLGAIGILLAGPSSNDTAALLSLASFPLAWTANWLFSLGLRHLLLQNSIGWSTYGRILLASDLCIATFVLFRLAASSAVDGHSASGVEPAERSFFLWIWTFMVVSQIVLMGLLGSCARSAATKAREDLESSSSVPPLVKGAVSFCEV